MSLCAWEAAREFILTIEMFKRRVNTLVDRYYICRADEKSCNHVMLKCLAVYNIWTMVYGLMGMN